MPNTDQNTEAKEEQPPPPAAVGQIASPLFVAVCLVGPILWGVIVHQVFKRLRTKKRPERPREAAWPDYQI